MIERRELAGVVVFAVVGVVLVALAPAKQSVEKASAVVSWVFSESTEGQAET